MNTFFILLSMFFMHVVADYNLQGILADMKCKKWWEDNPSYSSFYEVDFISALIMHSISWTFLIMLPIAIFELFKIDIAFCILFVINTVVHAIVDHLKANKKKLNLFNDQFIHSIQIFITWSIFFLMHGGGLNF